MPLAENLFDNENMLNQNATFAETAKVVYVSNPKIMD